MKNRKFEIFILLFAASLFIWGIVRAIKRGDTVVHSWTTYVMVGLIIVTFYNVQVRSKRISSIVGWICGFFILIVTLAAILGQPGGTSHQFTAVIRAILFFICIGTVSLIQSKTDTETIE